MCQLHAHHPTTSAAWRSASSCRQYCLIVSCHLQSRVSVPYPRHQAGLAATLLSALLAATPAASAAVLSSDYISVEDRVRQRAPLQHRKSDKYQNVEEPSGTSRLSIPQQALKAYTIITQKYPDLAISQYAKIKRALMLYQFGKTVDAVLAMEGEEEDLRGNAEVHAALAAMLYSESPKQIRRAETQWEIAKEFDQRYSDVDWVKKEKHWPPAMQTALCNFLDLK